MTVLGTFLEFSLNFLFQYLKKHYKFFYIQKKVELPKTQFQRIVKNKIAGKTHLELENDCFKHIFGILIKFPIQ